jgi:putative aminopeptidase FrvX
MSQSADKWLADLTSIPTASGLEQLVIGWVERWVSRRKDLRLMRDSGGNLLLTQTGRKRRAPVIAVAHMDHPAFVVTGVAEQVEFEFRGGVRPEYFAGARVDFVTGPGASGRISSYDPGSRTGSLAITGPSPAVGDIARWRFVSRKPAPGIAAAPAMDDLAGCAAALAALDRARKSDLTHFGVLLTRAEELGFVGAIHAAREKTIDPTARVLSIETSRASAETPVGGGPVVRVGDASTIFDNRLTNAISTAAARNGLRHQRKLMSGGSCEATAFGGFGYRTAGLCLALDNYHNMGDLSGVEEGRAKAIARLEEVSLEDFHGLIDLILIAVGAVDAGDDLGDRLETIYQGARHLLA